jgi:hypothetical protein
MKVETQSKVDHAPAELDEASRLLLKAAALIEDRGHCQGHPYGDFTSKASLCAVAAIFEANNKRFSNAAEFRLAAHLGLNKYGVAMWSDSSDEALVIAKMRAAALGL